jgi:hypothetical protein
MIITVKATATKKQLEKVTSTLKEAGCSFEISHCYIVSVTKGTPPKREVLEAIPCVEHVTKTI